MTTKIPTADDLVGTVCRVFDVEPEQLKTPSRRSEVRWPRQVCMAVLYSRTVMSASEVGRYFNRHHPAVLNAVRVVDAGWEHPVKNPQLQAVYAAVNELRPTPPVGASSARSS